MNKIDLKPGVQPKVDRDDLGEIQRVYLSALKKLGLNELISAMGEKIGQEMVEKTIELTPMQAKLRSVLYAQDAVLAEQVDEEGHYHLLVRMRRVELEKLFG